MQQINRATLPNGLRVIHSYDSATTMVALSVIYDVGAADEQPQLTGIAHLMEHLMFGGSVNIPSFDREIERAGGTDNAWTSPDLTCFYDILPAHNAETAFWLESDRMISPAFTQKTLDVQKGVVIEEFKQQCLNRPYGTLGHLIRSTAFTTHPYRWPVIGLTPDHVAAATLHDVRDFYFSHYSPSRAVLSVCGNITWDKTLALAEKWFASIPDRDTIVRDLPAEPPTQAPRHATTSGVVPSTLLSVNFPMPGQDSPDYIPADILSDILGTGTSSVLYDRLVRATDMFHTIDASIEGSRDPGLFHINAKLRDVVSPDTALEAIHTEVGRLVSEGVDDATLQRAINLFESARTLENLGCLPRCLDMAQNEIYHRDPADIMSRYFALTTADIDRAARLILDPRRATTVTFTPA